MPEPRAWTNCDPTLKAKIRQLAADNAARHKRTRFNDSRTRDQDPSLRDYYIDPNWNQKSRTVKVLVYRIGGMAKGDKVTVEYEDDGTANIFLVGPSDNFIGTIPPGADGEKWFSGSTTANGDQELPNANERMMTHTLEFPGGRRDPLLIHMNALHTGKVGMENFTAGYTVDDLIDQPTPMRSQSPPNGTKFPTRADGGDNNCAPVPLDSDLLELARQATSPNIIQDLYRQQEKRDRLRNNANGEDKRRHFGFMGATKDFLPGYRKGGESSKLHSMNVANRRHYGA